MTIWEKGFLAFAYGSLSYGFLLFIGFNVLTREVGEDSILEYLFDLEFRERST